MGPYWYFAYVIKYKMCLCYLKKKINHQISAFKTSVDNQIFVYDIFLLQELGIQKYQPQFLSPYFQLLTQPLHKLDIIVDVL